MLKSILVPVGDTIYLDKAMRHTMVLAQAFSARVHLLGMIQPSQQDSEIQFADPVLWHATKSRKQAALSELVAKLEAQNIPTELTVLDTCTLDTFIRYVDDGSFDLIVFPEDDRTLGVSMRDILAHTAVPVFSVRSDAPDRYERVLLPLDGSQRAECVMPVVTALAQTMGATLLLAHIIKEPEMPRLTSPNAEDVQLAEQLIERNRQESERYLTDLSTRLSVPTEIYLTVHNSITAALHDLIRQQNVDLVGLCAHGFSGKPEWPFGGITSNLIDHCPVSFMVLQDLPSELPAIESDAATRHSGGR